MSTTVAVSERTRKNSNPSLNQCFRERTPTMWSKDSQIFKGSARGDFTFICSIHSDKVKEWDKYTWFNLFYLTTKGRKYKPDLGSPIVLSFKQLTSMKQLLEEQQLFPKRINFSLPNQIKSCSFSERLLKLTGLKTSFLDLFTKSVTILL